MPDRRGAETMNGNKRRPPRLALSFLPKQIGSDRDSDSKPGGGADRNIQPESVLNESVVFAFNAHT
jgi:hypothetical protein